MSLGRLTTVLRHHWLLVVSLTACVVGAAGAWTYTQSPSYRASALLEVQPAMASDGSVSLQNTLSARERAATITALGNTADVRAIAKATLGSDAGLASCGFAQSGDSEFLTATCTGGSADAVARRANAYADALQALLERQRLARIVELSNAYRDQVRGLREQGVPLSSYPAPPAYPSYRELGTVEAATAPRSPYAPRPLRTLALALVLGLIVNSGIAFLLERLQNRARSLDELRHALDLTVLAAVPRIRRADAAVALRGVPTAQTAHADARSRA